MGRMLANLDVQVEQIITSPLKRARQTASLVANELAFESAVQLDDALRPEAQLPHFQAMLARLHKHESIMVGGHNPSLTEFLSKTISGGALAAHIDLNKCTGAGTGTARRHGTLEWQGTPKIACRH